MTTNTVSIEDVPLNKFHQLLSIRTGGGWLMDGYVLSIIGVALVQISSALHLNDFWQGIITASALLGIFVGGFLGGFLTTHLGRQKLYFVGPILFILCSIAQFWASSGLELFIWRFLIGIGVGFEYPVAGSLLVEFLPRKYRGSRLAMLTMLWFTGAALAYMVGNLILGHGGDEAWRYVLASPAVIGIFLVLVRLGTPESARWLVNKGRLEEAEQVIKEVYGDSYSLRNLPEQHVEKKTSLTCLLHSGYGARMLFVALFWSCSVIPVFAIYSFAPRMLKALNISDGWAAYISIIVTVMFVVGCIVATQLVNLIGRRSMVIHSFLWSGLALVGLGGLSDSGQLLPILILLGAYALFIGGAQVLQLVYPNELFPTEIRSFAVGMGASLSRIAAAIGTWLVPMSLTHFGISNTMYAAAAVTLTGLVVSLALAPETRSLSLHEAASLNH